MEVVRDTGVRVFVRGAVCCLVPGRDGDPATFEVTRGVVADDGRIGDDCCDGGLPDATDSLLEAKLARLFHLDTSFAQSIRSRSYAAADASNSFCSLCTWLLSCALAAASALFTWATELCVFPILPPGDADV